MRLAFRQTHLYRFVNMVCHTRIDFPSSAARSTQLEHDRVISPAAGCTMCPAAVHHLGGVRGPTWWCIHHGLGVGPAERVSVFSGQGVVFGRHIHFAF